jgi:hypothetical protein
MQDFEKLGVFYLGRLYDVRNRSQSEDLLLYDSKDLVTHAVCIGMTGSGKTGLCVSLVEEAAIDNIPAILIDPKGDITNLLLTFPELRSQDFAPWINEEDALKKGLSQEDYAGQQASLWKNGLLKWGQDGERIARLRQSADFVIYTPGSNAGLPISILKSFAAPPAEIREDTELLQERITTTATSLLGLLGIQADPIRSREHILISTIFAASWQRGEDLDIGRLIQLIQSPPMTRIGMLDVESFYPAKDRFELAMQLNNLLAAPGFGLWLEGDALDINGLLHSSSGKPRVSIFYIAHLNDAQRMFFVSLLLNQIVGWMRTQSGTTSLRSIVYIDEVFGYLPPVANPPSKTPLLTLLKQARAFGVGIVLATQNPVDLDYKALSNAGTWFIGRLQTERDKARVLDGLEGAAIAGQSQLDRKSMDQTMSALGNRVFLMNNVHENAPVVFETRWAMSYLRGPLTRDQIKVLIDPLKKQPSSMPLAQATGIQASTISAPSPTSLRVTSQRPVAPPDVRQYFAPVAESELKNATAIYEPMILGAAQVRFVDAKTKVDTTKDVLFLASITDEPVPVDWDNSKEANMKVSELDNTPMKGVPFADLPSAALVPRNYTSWEKDFSNWLFRTQKLQLLKSENLNEFSRPGETDRDFRIRLQQTAREQRDQQVEKLRRKYSSDFARLDERIRRVQATIQKHEAQSKGQKYQAAVSFGATLLGSFLGRRSTGSATRTAREIGRSVKEAKDKGSFEANLRALQEERADLETQFQSEVNVLESKTNPLTEQLETVSITPTKTNISIRLVTLLWTVIQ